MDVSAPIATGPHGTFGSHLINYNRESRDYDGFRRSIGMEFVSDWLRNCAARLTLPLERIRGASLCCGTGQNEEHLLELIEGAGSELEHLLLGDASDGMLETVEEKLEPFATPWETRHLDVVHDDFDEGLHFAMVVQATQHLDKKGDGFRNVRKLFSKVHRSLVQGGSFFLIISTPEQILSHWFASVMTYRPGVSPDIDPGRHFADEHAELDEMISMLGNAGLKFARMQQLEGPHFEVESYLGDPRIALDPVFRRSSSFFRIAELSGKLPRYDEVLRAMIASGDIHEHRRRCEAAREKSGVSYLIETRAC